MKKLISKVIILVILLVSLSSIELYAKSNYELTCKTKETKLSLENEQGTLYNTITNINSNDDEATIQLKLENKKEQEEGEKPRYQNTEVYIMVPTLNQNSIEKLKNYIETLCTKIFEENKNVKIGIIGITQPTDPEQKGSLEDAQVTVKATNELTQILEGLESLKIFDTNPRYGVNLEAGIKVAIQSFSENVNKILVNMYDNVPIIAQGIENRVTYGGIFGLPREEAIRQHNEKVVNQTKDAMLELSNYNIDFILLRPGDTSYDQNWTNEDGDVFVFDGSEFVIKLYGTKENPTYGKMYSLEDSDMETIVTEYFYNDIMEIVHPDMKNITIKNYFPQELLDNFEIEIINPEIGTVTNQIDLETKSVTWTIEELKGNKTAYLEYKIKLKNEQNIEELLNKPISTSEKVELTYTAKQSQEETKTVELTQNPQIELKEINDNNNANNNNNNNIPNTNNNNQANNINKPVVLPNAGNSIKILLAIAMVIIIAIILKIKITNLKDVK